MKKLFVICALCLMHCALIQAQDFHFNKEGKFRIMQLTDIHWTEGEAESAKTTETIKAVVTSQKPDLIIVTGDVVTGGEAMWGWLSVADLLNSLDTPFAILMGNHDAETNNDDKESIYQMLKNYEWHVGKRGPVDVSGCGNVVFNITDSEGKGVNKAVIYCLDSGDYPANKALGHYDWIKQNQIDRYRSLSNAYTKANGGEPLPSLAFFHIPLPEHDIVRNKTDIYGNKAEGCGEPMQNSGMFCAMIEQRDMMGVFVGHAHDNDFIGMHYGIALGFGRCTGSGAYGKFTRGARVIELTEGQRTFDTWIVTPEGAEPTYYYPSGINARDEAEAQYLKAVNATKQANGIAFKYYEGNFEKTADVLAVEKKFKYKGVMPQFSIDKAQQEDHFAFIYDTLIDIPERGIYVFGVESDDGAVLTIDGQVVVDNDGSHSRRYRDGRVALEKGLHKMRIVYFEDYMGNSLDVTIRSRFKEECTIPTNILYQP